MDITTLAMAKQYTNSQRLGYTKELTFNGNIEGKQYFEDLSVVKVSETAYDLSDVVSITGCDNGEMMKWTLPNPDFVLVTEGGGQFLAVASGPLVISFPKDSDIALDLGISGTWLWYISEDVYIAGIELIHPIDPKYLPGVCLPVVEFSTVLPSNIGVPKNMDAEESAKLDELASAGLPFVAKIGIFDGVAKGSFVMNYIIELESDAAVFIGVNGTVNINLQRENGVWIGLMSTIVDSETE